MEIEDIERTTKNQKKFLLDNIKKGNSHIVIVDTGKGSTACSISTDNPLEMPFMLAKVGLAIVSSGAMSWDEIIAAMEAAKATFEDE